MSSLSLLAASDRTPLPVPVGIDTHFLFLLKQTDTIEPVDVSKKEKFRKLWIYPASGITAGKLEANSAPIWLGKDGDGPEVTTDELTPTDGPLVILIPDSLPPMRVCDLIFQGTATDGAWISYIPV